MRLNRIHKFTLALIASTAITTLPALAADVNKEITELTNVYRSIAGGFATDPEAATQSFRQHAENALAAPGPLLKAEDRVKLVIRVREVGMKLAQGSQAITISPTSGATVTLSDTIADQ